MKNLLILVAAISMSWTASAQEKRKPLLVSAKTVSSFKHSYYNAKSRIVGTKIVTDKYGNRTSVATVMIYGNIEGNLCLDNRVLLNSKSLSTDYNSPVWKETIELSFYTFKQHYGKQPMKIGSTIAEGCTLHGEIRPFAMRVSFEGFLGKKGSDRGKSGIFNVMLRNHDHSNKHYKFRVTYNVKKNQWQIKDL